VGASRLRVEIYKKRRDIKLNLKCWGMGMGRNRQKKGAERCNKSPYITEILKGSVKQHGNCTKRKPDGGIIY